MKTSEAVNALEALSQITHAGRAVPQKFAYAAIRNKAKLAEAVAAYNIALDSLLQIHGKKDNGVLLPPKQVAAGKVQFELESPEAQAIFAQEHDKLLNEDLSDLTMHAVAIEQFPDALPLGVMEALMPMVLEEVVPAKEAAKPAEAAT